MDTKLDVTHLFTMSLVPDLNTIATIQHGSLGLRRLVGGAGGTFSGERLRGKVVPGVGGDWMTGSEDGRVWRVEVRLLLRTEDEADILMEYAGIARVEGTSLVARTAALFETAHERYAWMNSIQAVGIGGVTPTSGGPAHEFYELL